MRNDGDEGYPLREHCLEKVQGEKKKCLSQNPVWLLKAAYIASNSIAVRSNLPRVRRLVAPHSNSFNTSLNQLRALFQAVTDPVVTERYENGCTVGKVKQTMEKVAYLGHVPVIVCIQQRMQSQPFSDGPHSAGTFEFRGRSCFALAEHAALHQHSSFVISGLTASFNASSSNDTSRTSGRLQSCTYHKA